MTSVAGDLYDFLEAADTRTSLLISDVSGHGVPAALIASMVKMAAISQRTLAAHPAQLLAGMNAALCGNTQGQYVTAACVHLDAETRSLRYAAAGHPAMLMLRSGAVTEVAENGLLLAATTQATYSEITLPLQPGDRFLLCSDGLSKTLDLNEMIRLLSSTDATPPSQQLIDAALARHVRDNVTAIVVEIPRQ